MTKPESPAPNAEQDSNWKNNMEDLQELKARIYTFRGKQVLLDRDLAEMYGVEVSQLKRAVRRNIERFPDDFAFELNNSEFNELKMSIRCQFGIFNEAKDFPKYAPIVFTEQGVAMLSGVLKSPTAVQVNIRIMRAFVAIRQQIAAQRNSPEVLEYRIKQLEDAFEESLRDRNDIDEDTRLRIELLEESFAEFRATLTPNNHRQIIKGFNQQ